ncbi:MAG: hypothetical protein MUF66_15525, partial [Gammaproteobacteria bacterium]|nr:hypothetical protein [Gammaproteobacteria bacterium]
MTVVLGVIEALGQVAARAERVALPSQAQAVGLVAVAAGHPRPVHRALQKGPVLVDLVPDLPIGEVEPLIEEAHPVGVPDGTTVQVGLVQQGAARVATRAGLDLAGRRPGLAAAGDAALGLH